MALFGSSRDISFILKVNNELLDNVIQQEVDYYKLYIPDISSTDAATNLYGEGSSQKAYYKPVRITCLVDRTQGFQAQQDDQFGIDVTSAYLFRFLRPKLEEIGLSPDIGDIIEDRGNYYEVDNTNEIQFIAGKDKDYGKNVGIEFGRNLSLECAAHLTRVTRLQIIKFR